MKFFKKSLVFVAVFIIMGGTFVNLSSNSYAQDAAGSGLRVSPTRAELTIDPGKSKEIVQTVKNVTSNPVLVTPTLNDFESNGVTGDPVLVSDPQTISAHSLRNFLSLVDNVRLEPDEEKDIRIVVSVPENASPGAYYGSILYKAAPIGSAESGQVSLIASVGSLVLVEVPGDLVEQINILDVSAYLDDKAGSVFTKKPTDIGVNIENLGNGFSKPIGSIIVKDWRGNNIFNYELNDVTSLRTILPKTTRLFKNELNNIEVKTVNGKQVVEKHTPIKWPGRYSITANISYGSSGQTYSKIVNFWYIPLWLILGLLALILLLIGSTFYLWRKYVTKSTRRRRR